MSVDIDKHLTIWEISIKEATGSDLMETIQKIDLLETIVTIKKVRININNFKACAITASDMGIRKKTVSRKK